jgi:hypothetical protein
MRLWAAAAGRKEPEVGGRGRAAAAVRCTGSCPFGQGGQMLIGVPRYSAGGGVKWV